MGRAAGKCRGVIIAGATLLVALTAAQGWCAENGVPAFATVRKSLAIVAAPEGKGFTLGTAFCIESDAKRSYFLTNAHVVQDNDVVALRLDLDHQVYRGFVVRTSVAPLDAAVIEIPKGNVPVLSLSRALPEAGAPIAIAGYPAIQLDTDLEPSVHAGLVNDVIRGYYIEHDAVTDRGNSGGPLFDPQTGLVYGIVTAFVPSQTARAVQNDIAIGVGQALPFLRNAGVTATYATPVVAAATAGSPAATPIAAWKPWASPPPDVATSPPPAPSPSHGPVAPKSDFLTCVEALEKLAYQHAVDCSITYMAGLEPDLSRLKTASASESITTLGKRVPRFVNPRVRLCRARGYAAGPGRCDERDRVGVVYVCSGRAGRSTPLQRCRQDALKRDGFRDQGARDPVSRVDRRRAKGDKKPEVSGFGRISDRYTYPSGTLQYQVHDPAQVHYGVATSPAGPIGTVAPLILHWAMG